MKKFFTFLMIMAFAVAAMAQAPEKFSYQAVVRDASGNLVCNGQVGVRVSILKNSANGVSVYCETHQLTTNANGLLTMEIGGGNVVGGVFSTIDWGNGPYFVKTETDVTGGSNYTLTGTQQLLSVPYALYAKYAENGGSGGSGSDTTGLAALANRVAQLEQQVQLPLVYTYSVGPIVSNSATIFGKVMSHGLSPVTVGGFCWSTSPQPTLADNYIASAISDDGYFLVQDMVISHSLTITGLTPNTTYYVRAYATNSQGTAYGNELSFTTVNSPDPCPGAATVTDIDNNTYNTVKIGNQCWMKENLRTTRYADGTTTPYRYPDNDANNVPTYGYLYNWPAVMHGASSSSTNPSGVQGICPNGWHVPSDAEWTQLTNYVGGQTPCQCNNSSDYIAKALASTTGWYSSGGTCAVGNNPISNNATGFSALPAGRYYNDYSLSCYGAKACFWSATEYDDDYAYGRDLEYNYANVGRSNGTKNYGCSVRCVRD